MDTTTSADWTAVCSLDQLQANAGVAALVDGRQVALFYLPSQSPSVYAIDNYDPIAGAYVLSRGIVGDLAGALVVASPVYKQHFRLSDGQCLEDEAVRAGSWACRVEGGQVLIKPN